MREILFRGKCKDDGSWVEGGVLQIPGYTAICAYDDYHGWHDFVEVIPDTVGQYTGLTDKNGKKIFEGDIVRTQPFSNRPYSSRAKYKQHVGVVEYRVRHFKNRFHEQDYGASWELNIKDIGEYRCYDWSAFFMCEIIGNIHDNPELLKGGE